MAFFVFSAGAFSTSFFASFFTFSSAFTFAARSPAASTACVATPSHITPTRPNASSPVKSHTAAANIATIMPAPPPTASSPPIFLRRASEVVALFAVVVSLMGLSAVLFKAQGGLLLSSCGRNEPDDGGSAPPAICTLALESGGQEMPNAGLE